MSFDILRGCRVFLVEDEVIIALDIEDLLLEMGCVVTGPIGTLEAAMQMADDVAFDAAILDIDIRGGNVYPVARRLLARGTPFVLASGHNDGDLPEDLGDAPRLRKPFTRQELEECMKLLCARLRERRVDAGGP